MSDRSPILEYSDNNPIPTYVAPAPDLTIKVLLTESGHAIATEGGHVLREEPLPGPR